ncbi:MAG: hypothetical protein PSX79_16620 [bacterium]|nr:hypothetical protein [bacterium]
MKFVLTASLFQDLVDDIAILGFLQRSMSKRCYIAVRSPNAQGYLEWLQGLPKARRTAWDTQLAWTTRDAAQHRITPIEVIAGPASDWGATPPQLTTTDALSLVDTPFKILLENGRFDRAFLLAMMPSSFRPFFEWLEHTDQLMFFGTGGLGELKKVVDEQVSRKEHRRLTHWAMFDSDAGAPGERSRDARQAVEACQERQVPFHILQRRALENYVPKAALFDWANSGGADAGLRRERIDALFRMTPEQRHHFHFKSGFPQHPSASEGALFATVPGDVRATLAGGIHKNAIGRLFTSATQDRLCEQVGREGSGAELLPGLTAVMELLRVPYG